MTVVTRSYRYALVTAPAVEPVTLAQAKAHLRVTTTDEDTYITDKITAARVFIENQTRRALVNTTYKLMLDEFPDEIRLPGGTLQSVTHVKYYDVDGVQQTLSTALYASDLFSVPGRVYPAFDEEWPSIQDRPNAIEIQYVVGFGAAAANVPDDLKDAVLMMVAHRFEHREPIITGTIVSDVPLAVQTIIINNKIQEFF